MSTQYELAIRILPGFGGYWEAEIFRENEREIIRSYKLANLMEAIDLILDDFLREND